MPRYRLTIEYDGSGFVGWQRQSNGPSVQAAVEEALFRFSGERTTVGAAGRTDAGVHALAQVVHLDLGKDWPATTVRQAVNQHLKPAPVAVLEAARVGAEFDARFSATARRYRYRIVNREAPLTLDRGRAWQVREALDAEAMHGAAQRLVGRHDFTTFRSSQCQAKSPLKTLDALAVRRAGEEVHIDARARSFLHNQVRAMVGTLKLVGAGKWSADDLSRALAAGERSACGATAPACGLYLVAVEYEGGALGAGE